MRDSWTDVWGAGMRGINIFFQRIKRIRSEILRDFNHYPELNALNFYSNGRIVTYRGFYNIWNCV